MLDAVPTPAEIDRALARLEVLAREQRHRGRRTPPRCRPRSTRIAEWAKTAEERGFVLVPISVVAIKSKSS